MQQLTLTNHTSAAYGKTSTICLQGTVHLLAGLCSCSINVILKREIKSSDAAHWRRHSGQVLAKSSVFSSSQRSGGKAAQKS
jgi:hypothetical protein